MIGSFGSLDSRLSRAKASYSLGGYSLIRIFSTLAVSAFLALWAGVPEAPAEVTAGQRDPRPFARFELDRLSEFATQVVAGVVEETESTWNHDRSRIYTRVTLRVEQLLAGQAGDAVVFQIPGGRVGNLASVPSHTPEFRVGEDVLVFLRGARGRLPSVLGGTFGKIPLAREPDGALRLLFPIEPGVEGGVGPLTRLDELRESVRGYRVAARR